MNHMTKEIQQNDATLHQCEECGYRYEDKSWSEKCEAWCKEHHSCNLEIIAHGVAPKGEAEKPDARDEKERLFNTRLLYGLMGVVSSLAFALLLYWALRLDSSITNVITNTYATPLYFWPYVILTAGAIVLFGINAALLAYRFRKFGMPKLKTGNATGAGSLVGIAASACPVCGSTILSAIGIAGGLAAFPLGGLELKALSLGFLALPVWLIRKDLKKLEDDCANGTCPAPKDHRFKESDRPWLLGLIVAAFAVSFVGWNMLTSDPIVARALSQGAADSGGSALYGADASSTARALFDEAVAQVLPEQGFQSKIALGDSMVKLVENGVIDREKFLAIYKDRGGMPDELKNALDRSSSKPITLTRENANYYVNLLWPLGLANYMDTNKKSPILGDSLFNFASTGGWNLGKEENGGAYFNKFKIVELTPEQEALVTKVAKNTYRPCCNNSTFYQDCNHGSALLGLLQLGAAQDLSEDDLYREALAFNSFWFPDTYIQTALYFKAAKNIDWSDVDPKLVMGEEYSSISGWYKNVEAEVQRLGLVPQQQGGANCGA